MGRRAVSPVIAVLLLVAISVAAATLFYTWAIGMIATTGRQAQTSIRIELVEFLTAGPGDHVNITVRNTGSVPAIIESIYITDPNGTTISQFYHEHNVIDVGRTSKFVFSKFTDCDPNWRKASVAYYKSDDSPPHLRKWVVSSTYVIKVVTDTGFTAEATYYSPPKRGT